MEKIKVLEFLADIGSGNGDGTGVGTGTSYGTGTGYGVGNGYGTGYGYGDGSGSGTKYGAGYSTGYSTGVSNGTGSGDDIGSGDGDGYGSGIGTSYGTGTGYGVGNDIRIYRYLDKEVYYADSIPTIFLNIKGNVAKVQWISTDDFSAKDGYLVKEEGYLAHGTTVREAFNELKEKIFSNLNFEDRLVEFKKYFLSGKKYKGTEFFVWHGLLTGSCLAGRESFVKSNNIDLKAGYTVSEFLSLCKGAYGWDKIKKVVK